MFDQSGEWLQKQRLKWKTARLFRLIDRMNDRGTENWLEGWKTKAEKAYREADRMNDPECLPILRQMILQHQQPEKEAFREAAYYLMGRLLSRCPVEEDIAFYIEQMMKESNQDVQFRMLVHLGRIQIPETQSMEGIIALVHSERELLQEAAIYALGSQQSARCREVLCGIAALDDWKKHQGAIMAAQSALRKNGTMDDIHVLEKNLHSASRNIRENAAAVMEEIRKRNIAAK